LVNNTNQNSIINKSFNPISNGTLYHNSSLSNSENEAELIEGVVVSDSQYISLEDNVIPGGNYIHLYDITPYKILNGHVAAKLPCNNNNATDILVLIGQNVLEYKIAKSEFIPQLSDSGNLCLYHLDLELTSSENPITGIVILNNSTSDTTFQPTSSIIIDVSKIIK